MKGTGEERLQCLENGHGDLVPHRTDNFVPPVLSRVIEAAAAVRGERSRTRSLP
ncbi:hypothetical protein [Streptomyces sp. AA4]|uniref:hypothetical protein n=1 Tax=Streptomyces sp. AA4 TaxID=591158 RepID=UPI001319D143|nr:hypothetical protein [Streptomyces sp. AA4]